MPDPQEEARTAPGRPDRARVGAGWAMLGVAAALATGCAETSDRVAPPNVLVIVMDTTRADHCSTDGYAHPTTPRLEQFAADGVNFRDAWVPAGWTAPTHASLFTGMRPLHHGLIDGSRMHLAESSRTLAETLRDSGWATGCFSNNTVVSDEFGLTQGFDEIVPFFLLEDVPRPWARGTHARALDFARTASRSGRPFFAFINDLEPHQPYAPPAEWVTRVRGAEPQGPAAVLARRFNNPFTLRCNIGDAVLAPEVARLLPEFYDGEIAHLDDEIGRLLDSLEQDGLLDRTLVIVTSDHGENLGDHGLWGHRFSLHRSIRRVPLVVRLPGTLDGGREVTDLVRLEDVFPTVLEACGLPVPEGLDGRSLLAALPGRISRASWGPQSWPRPSMQQQYPSAESPLFDLSIRAVYDGRHHLMVTDDGVVELYDVSADPAETRNLADELPDVVLRLRAELDP